MTSNTRKLSQPLSHIVFDLFQTEGQAAKTENFSCTKKGLKILFGWASLQFLDDKLLEMGIV